MIIPDQKSFIILIKTIYKNRTSIKNIDIIILAGGLGTRLRSIIGNNPKCLSPVNGQPFIHFLMDQYVAQGFKRFIVSVGYQKEKVIKSLKFRKDCKIIFCEEYEPLGTGGAIKKSEQYITSNNVIIINGDSFINLNTDHLVNWHYKMESDCTIVATEIENSNRYGTIEIGKKSRLVGFKEKNDTSSQGLVNAGIYVMNKSIFNLMPDEKPFSVELEFFPKILNESTYAYICNKELIDIGTPDSYKKFMENYQKYIR